MRDPTQAPQLEEHVVMIEGVRFEDEGLGPRHDQGKEHDRIVTPTPRRKLSPWSIAGGGSATGHHSSADLAGDRSPGHKIDPHR